MLILITIFCFIIIVMLITNVSKILFAKYHVKDNNKFLEYGDVQEELDELNAKNKALEKRITALENDKNKED